MRPSDVPRERRLAALTSPATRADLHLGTHHYDSIRISSIRTSAPWRLDALAAFFRPRWPCSLAALAGPADLFDGDPAVLVRLRALARGEGEAQLLALLEQAGRPVLDCLQPVVAFTGRESRNVVSYGHSPESAAQRLAVEPLRLPRRARTIQRS
jgi:hypothetical protein